MSVSSTLKYMVCVSKTLVEYAVSKTLSVCVSRTLEPRTLVEFSVSKTLCVCVCKTLVECAQPC